MQNETKNTNKTNHNACTNSSDGNNYVIISSKRISSIKKSTKKGKQSLRTSNQEKQSSEIYKLFSD